MLDGLVFRAWDAWERSDRMAELARLTRSQWLSAAALRSMQADRTRAIVHHAYSTVPYYRRRWRDAGVGPDSEFSSLPILLKSDVRSAGDQLLSESADRSTLRTSKTGGSTGTALRLWFDFQCQQSRNAAAMRSDGWAGWRPGKWTACLWGSPVLPRTLRGRARNLLRDRLYYLDTMRLDEDSIRRFLDVANRRKHSILFGHAHSLYVLATFLASRAEPIPSFDGIISTSMSLLAGERATIESVFNKPVQDRYGCEEVGLIASQCSHHGAMHVNSDHVLVEILRDDGTPAAQGEVGRIVVTDLINRAMPLIRYEVGDLATASDSTCPCGRGLPVIERVVGRTADCFQRRDGSRIAGISLVERTLTAVPGLAQLQLIQHGLSSVEARAVVGGDVGSSLDQMLKEKIDEAFGYDVDLNLTVVDALTPEPNGKYRFTICRIPS
jgi:phenylacetate-CoA ligase